MTNHKKTSAGSNKSSKKNLLRGSAILVLIAAVLLLNIGMLFLPERYVAGDITKNKVYTISEETKSFLNSLDEDVTLYLIGADGSDTQYEYFLERLTEYSDRLTLKLPGKKRAKALLEKVGYSTEEIPSYYLIAESSKRCEIIDYTSLFFYETENEVLNEYGLTKMSWAEYAQYVQYYEKVAAQNSNYEEYLNYLLYDTFMYFQGEAMITAMIEYAIADIIPVNYAITGHGEKSYTGSILEHMLSTYGNTYVSLELSLVEEIPEDAATLLIQAPEKDYSASEILMLRAYLERGGQVVAVTNEANLSMPNLMSLMSSYGLSALSGAVGEVIVSKDSGNETGEEVTEETEEKTKESLNYELEVSVNTQHDALALGKEENAFTPVITGGNALLFGENGDSSLILSPLLTTSESAFVGDNTEDRGERILAASAENATGAHLLWFTGAESYCMSVMDVQSGLYDSATAITNNFCIYLVMGWANLRYESNVILPEAVNYSSDYLGATGSDLLIFGLIFLVCIPTAVIVAGVIVRYKRKQI